MRNDYRHEIKHEITRSDMFAIRQALGAVCLPDVHAVGGKYNVRSLYFDTPFDTALRQKLDGVRYREKFRIRIYNHDTSFIRLEKKTKLNAMGTKDMAMLTEGEVRRIIRGDISWMGDRQDCLLREFYTHIVIHGLKAKVLVDYTREPFTYSPGNVRVTIDYDIRTGLSSTDFFDFDCPSVPVKLDPVILEVKWDAFLPSVIRQVLQLNRREEAYSKYAACRMYD